MILDSFLVLKILQLSFHYWIQSPFQRLPLSSQGPQKGWVPWNQHVPLRQTGGSSPLCPFQATQHRKSVLQHLWASVFSSVKGEDMPQKNMDTGPHWPLPSGSPALSFPILPLQPAAPSPASSHPPLHPAPPSHNLALSSVPQYSHLWSSPPPMHCPT